MYLEVTLDDGSVTQAALSNSHTLQIISPDNTVQNAFAVQGMKSLELKDGEIPTTEPPAAAPAPTEPGPVVPTDNVPDAQAAMGADPAPAADGNEDEAHASAVSNANEIADAVVQAADAPVDAKQAAVAGAQADVEAALAQWPDSQPLLDAKARLEQLAADITPAQPEAA